MHPQAENLNPSTKSRSLGISLGVTEVLHLLGLLFLAAGITITFGFEYALIVVGLFLIRTAEINARERHQEK